MFLSLSLYTYIYIYTYLLYIYIYTGFVRRRQTCYLPNVLRLRLQSSEWKFTTSREIEPVRRSFRRRRSCTFTEVARLVPSGFNRQRKPKLQSRKEAEGVSGKRWIWELFKCSLIVQRWNSLEQGGPP